MSVDFEMDWVVVNRAIFFYLEEKEREREGGREGGSSVCVDVCVFPLTILGRAGPPW